LKLGHWRTDAAPSALARVASRVTDRHPGKPPSRIISEANAKELRVMDLGLSAKGAGES